MKPNKLLWILPLIILIVMASVSAGAPSNDDTVAYWALENLTDSTGTYTLTSIGATSGATGIIDNAYSLDGSNDQLKYENININGFTELTINIWAKFDDYDGTQRLISLTYDGNEDIRFAIVSSKMQFTLDDGTAYTVESGTLSDTTNFHMYTLTFDGTTLRGYIDGSSVGTPITASFGFATAVGKFSVSSYAGSASTTPFDGVADEVSIFNKALSADEITYLFEGGAPTSDQQYPFASSTEVLTTNITSIYLNPNGTVYEDETGLNGVITLNQTSGIYLNYTYYVNDVAEVTGQITTGISSTTNFPDLNPSNFDFHEEVIFEAIAVNSSNTSQRLSLPKNSTALEIANQVPVVTQSYISPSSATNDTEISFYCSFTDKENDEANLSVKYYKNGALLSSNSIVRSTPSTQYFGSLPANQTEVGDNFTFECQAINSEAEYSGGTAQSSNKLNSTMLTISDIANFTINIYDRWDNNLVNFSIPTGGVAYYDFEGDYNDNWGSNDGTNNGATLVDSKTTSNYYSGEKAGSFDGVNDYIETSNSITSYPFTISYWGKTTDTVGVKTAVSIADSTNTNIYINTGFYNDEKAFCGIRNTAIFNTYSTSSLDDGEYHLITCVYDSDTSRVLYVDGVYQSTQSTSVNFPVTVDRIGFGVLARSSLADYYQGSIDDVMIFDRALSPTEISTIYNEGRPDGARITANIVNPNSSVDWNTVNTTLGDDDTIFTPQLFDYYKFLYNGSEINVPSDCLNLDPLEFYESNGELFCGISPTLTRRLFDYSYDEELTLIGLGDRIYKTSQPTIITNIISNETTNITIDFEEKYFDITYNHQNLSENLIAQTYQNNISFLAYQYITRDLLSGLTFTIDGKNGNYQYLPTGTYTLYAGGNGYFNKSNTITITSLETSNRNVTDLFNAYVNLTANDFVTAESITGFNGWIYQEDYDYNETYNTTSTYKYLPLIKDLIYTFYLESDGYVYSNESNTNTSNVTTTPYNINFALYPARTVIFNFFNQETLNLIDNQTTDLLLLVGASGQSASTDNGTITIENLTLGSYIIYYNSSGYEPNYHYFTLGVNDFYNLSLYLLENTSAIPVTITVIDQNANDLEGAIVKALKYYESTNSYIQVASGKTDSNGETIINLVINDGFYKFIVEYEGETVKVTNPATINSNTLLIQVDTGGAVFTDFFDFINFQYSLTYNEETNNFRYNYNDINGISSGDYCLYVYRMTGTSGNILLDSSCSSSTAATLLISITPVNGTTYLAQAYYGEEYVDGLTIEIGDTDVISRLGLLLQILLTLMFAGIAMWDTSLLPIGISISLLFGKMIGLNVIPYGTIAILFAVSLIIAFFINKYRS